MTTIYQVPCETYNQFITYLNSFNIAYEVKRDNSEPHTYGLIQIKNKEEVLNDIGIVLEKLITWYNKH